MRGQYKYEDNIRTPCISTPRGVYVVIMDIVTVDYGHSRSSRKYLRYVCIQVDNSTYMCILERYARNILIITYNFRSIISKHSPVVL